ncbi:MAG TPA: hypothetical protein VGD08_14120 [Stellaceae bacterium]|jgi:hypothetical protein
MFPVPPRNPGPTLCPKELRLRGQFCAREAEHAASPYTADLFRRLAVEYGRRADAIERGEPPPLSAVLPNPVGKRRRRSAERAAAAGAAIGAGAAEGD